jgi:hypothetical protein
VVRLFTLVVALLAVLAPAVVTAQESPADTTTTTTTTPPPTLPHFEQFETETWHDDWLDWRSTDERNTSITRAYQENGLRINIPPSERRGTGPLWRLPEDVDQAWFRYRIRFDDFYPVTAGKLPGFAGLPSYTARGCYPSTEAAPGWSARMLFEPSGYGDLEAGQIQIGYYTYHLDQAGTCGDFMLWDSDGVLDQDHWYCIEGRVRMNTPGASDGLLQGWVDNELAFDQDGLRFRRATEDWLDVRNFWLDVYFGGSIIPNDRNLTMRIDDLAVSETGRLGCPNRFRDDDGNPHEGNIEWMFQREYIYGCDTELYCPTAKLTRAATAALLDRILDPPATATDFFTDDEGHWAESAMNRIAAAGILRGCGEQRACPDEPVTRGQFAALLSRAFAIPDSPTDFFVDDNGGIFEADINSIAAIGVTKGCENTDDRYCPTHAVLRDQAATLLARAIQWWEG